MIHYLVRDISYYCNITAGKCTKLTLQPIPYYDFTLVLEGELTYHANDQTYILHKNDALFLRPGTLRSREPGTKKVRYVSFNFYISEDAELPFEEYIPKCITVNMRRILSTYPAVHLTTLPYSKEKCVSMLNHLLYELLEELTPQNLCPNEHILEILNYIDNHIHEKLSLQNIANEVNMSKEYISYLFRKEMHRTLTDYINERKLLIAHELILLGEMSLTDVASYMGYENYNYFCRLFKRYYEMTPSQLLETRT